jgi:hypothetical protein
VLDGKTTLIVGNTGTILRSTFSPTTGIEPQPGALPVLVRLEQNYPNPFNPGTSIAFRTAGPGTSRVRLGVYDLLGREVALLVDEPKNSGEYAVRFDGSHLASGLYIYRLAVDDAVEVRKMLLLK